MASFYRAYQTRYIRDSLCFKKYQKADIMTKPLAKPKIEYLGKQIMGW